MQVKKGIALSCGTRLGIVIGAFALASIPGFSQRPNQTQGLNQARGLTQAEDLYQHTDYQRSIGLLDKQSNDPAVQFLLGRDYFMLGDFKKASECLENAVYGAPASAEYVDWLGRAYGKRAENSNLLFAPGFASKARQAFEKSVEVNPRDSDALSDLFDYYLDAPGFMGGGYDKAFAVTAKMAVFDPSEAYFERSKLAQKKKEYQDAEQELRQSIAIAPRSVGHLIELAKLLSTQGHIRESDDVLLQARQVAPNSPRVWFATANIYIQQKRNLDEAKSLLVKYVQAAVTVDDPPKQEALRLLRQAGGE
jgi:tetratricopeptide (TPR) repeat protein